VRRIRIPHRSSCNIASKTRPNKRLFGNPPKIPPLWQFGYNILNGPMSALGRSPAMSVALYVVAARRSNVIPMLRGL
jgi:hypothetical protein